jgi:maltose/moltooligosaccharide transporter
MPDTMKRLSLVQVCTWFGLFCMWLYFPVAVATNVFGGTPGTPEYQRGVEWAGICFGAYSAVCFAFAFLLPPLARKRGRKATHAMCLLAGAAGLLSVSIISNPTFLLLSMVGVGIAWPARCHALLILAGAICPEDRRTCKSSFLHHHSRDPGLALVRLVMSSLPATTGWRR